MFTSFGFPRSGSRNCTENTKTTASEGRFCPLYPATRPDAKCHLDILQSQRKLLLNFSSAVAFLARIRYTIINTFIGFAPPVQGMGLAQCRKSKGYPRRERPAYRSAVPCSRFSSRSGEYGNCEFWSPWDQNSRDGTQAVPYKSPLHFRHWDFPLLRLPFQVDQHIRSRYPQGRCRCGLQ